MTLHFWGGGWWRYSEGRYRLVDELELRQEVTRAVKQECDRRPAADGIPPRVTKGLVADVTNALMSLDQVALSSSVAQPSWIGSPTDAVEYIALQNGLFDVTRFLNGFGGNVRQHTPDWFSPVCLPYPYNPGTECRGWVNFLNWMFEGDSERIDFVQEWFGYCLVLDTSHQKFLMVEGPGANGKSVLLATLEALVGQDNCSYVPLENFRSEFRLAAAVGKLVNIVAEIGDSDRLPEGMLKTFVAGERMSFNRKYRSPLEVKATARLVFATNRVPRFVDQSEGVWRRLVILPARVVVPPDQQNKSLAEELRQELPGIFNWALNGLVRLRNRRRFLEPGWAQQAQEEHRATSDPARAFLLRHLVKDPNGEVPSERLFGQCIEWCADQGYRQVSGAELGKAMTRVFPGVERRRLGSRDARSTVYVGVRGVRADPTVSNLNELDTYEEEKNTTPPDTYDTAPEVEDGTENDAKRPGQQ